MVCSFLSEIISPISFAVFLYFFSLQVYNFLWVVCSQYISLYLYLCRDKHNASSCLYCLFHAVSWRSRVNIFYCLWFLSYSFCPISLWLYGNKQTNKQINVTHQTFLSLVLYTLDGVIPFKVHSPHEISWWEMFSYQVETT